jgi:hypothetical protein
MSSVQVAREARELDGATAVAGLASAVSSQAPSDPKAIELRRAAKKSRTALLKWLQGVSEATVAST